MLRSERVRRAALLPALIALAACAADGGAGSGEGDDVPFEPEYMGVRTLLLDDDLVNFRVRMRGARDEADVTRYAECAAAQYALIRGYGFARHVRTTLGKEGGIWRADAVYTISPALPEGLRTIDAEVTVADCTEAGVSTV